MEPLRPWLPETDDWLFQVVVFPQIIPDLV